jgi:hypothetical protein
MNGGWGRTVYLIFSIDSLLCRMLCGLTFSCGRSSWFIVLFWPKILNFFFCYNSLMSAHVALSLLDTSLSSTYSSVSAIAAVTLWQLWDLSPISFSSRGPGSVWANICVIVPPYALLRPLWIYFGLLPSALRNSVTTLCPVLTSTTSAIFHSCCVERKWLTGAPMNLAELDSATTRWARQEPPPASHLFLKKTRKYSFLPTFVSSFTGLYCLGSVQKVSNAGDRF